MTRRRAYARAVGFENYARLRIDDPDVGDAGFFGDVFE
jgi:hypothetical protein